MLWTQWMGRLLMVVKSALLWLVMEDLRIRTILNDTVAVTVEVAFEVIIEIEVDGRHLEGEDPIHDRVHEAHVEDTTEGEVVQDQDPQEIETTPDHPVVLDLDHLQQNHCHLAVLDHRDIADLHHDQEVLIKRI